VATWNVNGLRAVVRRGDLQKLIEAERPDVLLLQEIKMNEPLVEFAEYVKFDSYAAKKGYAGTSVWIKAESELSVTLLAKQPGVAPLLPEGQFTLHRSQNSNSPDSELTDHYGDLLDEGRIATVKIGGVNFVSVYVPNSKEDLSRLAIRERWDKWLKEYLDELEGAVVVGGDFNVAATELDLARPKENRGKHGFTDEERAGFAELLTGYDDAWREQHPEERQYSWWSHYGHAREKNVGWRIDYLLTRGVKLRDARILDQVKGSDHAPVIAEVAELKV
jgi:exodeoxyribonuclease-3